MMESTPYITPADPLPATTSVIQSQIPLVQSTQISTPVITSQVLPATSMVTSTPVVTTAPQMSYVPVPSTLQQASQVPIHSGVKVVPIYDDF